MLAPPFATELPPNFCLPQLELAGRAAGRAAGSRDTRPPPPLAPREQSRQTPAQPPTSRGFGELRPHPLQQAFQQGPQVNAMMNITLGLHFTGGLAEWCSSMADESSEASEAKLMAHNNTRFQKAQKDMRRLARCSKCSRPKLPGMHPLVGWLAENHAGVQGMTCVLWLACCLSRQAHHGIVHCQRSSACSQPHCSAASVPPIDQPAEGRSRQGRNFLHSHH